MHLTFIISTRCGILSAQATCSGDPMIGLHRFTLAPFSSKILTSVGSPRSTAKSSGLGRSGSGSGAGMSTRAPCLMSRLTSEALPGLEEKEENGHTCVVSLYEFRFLRMVMGCKLYSWVLRVGGGGQDRSLGRSGRTWRGRLNVPPKSLRPEFGLMDSERTTKPTNKKR